MAEMPLADRFDAAMRDLYGKIVRECGRRHHPRDFHGMIEEHGELATAHILLRDPNFFPYGFSRLCALGRPGLTMEAMILELDYDGPGGGMGDCMGRVPPSPMSRSAPRQTRTRRIVLPRGSVGQGRLRPLSSAVPSSPAAPPRAPA